MPSLGSRKSRPKSYRHGSFRHFEQLETRRMLTASAEWTYVHTEAAGTDYVLRVSGDSLVIVSDVTENVLASTPMQGLDQLRIQGSTADDNLIVDFSFGNPIPAGGLIYDGGDQHEGDALELRHQDPESAPVALSHYTFWNEHDGHIHLDGIGELTFLGLEPIIDNLSATDRVFDFTGGSEVIRVFDDGTDGNNLITVDSNFAEEVTFSAPTNSLTLNLNDGPNVVDVESWDSAFNVPQFTINGDADVDQVFVQAAIPNTTLNIDLHGGEDLVFVEATAIGGQTNIDVGEGNDRVSISDTNASTSSLDAILSDLVIEGGSNDVSGATETLAVSVSAKDASISGQVDVAVTVGDILEIVDNGSMDPHNYVYSGNRLQRTSVPTGEVAFSGFETIQVTTGQNQDTVVVSATASATQTQILTQDGDDVVRVLGTGDDSLLQLDLGAGMDDASISLVGNQAIARVNGDDDPDQLTLAGSGFQSGVEFDGGDGNDLIEVHGTGNDSVNRIRGGAGADEIEVQATGNDTPTEVSGDEGADQLRLLGSGQASGVALLGGSQGDSITVAGTGPDSLLRVDGEGGGDTLNIRATGMGSQTDVVGGAASDTINISSDAPAMLGDLDGILGSICVIGGAHDEATMLTETVTSTASAKGSSVTSTVTASVVDGDMLQIADRLNATQEYVLTGSALVRGTDQTISYEEVEVLEVTSGSGDDAWVVGSTPGEMHVTLNTGGGRDSLRVISTGNGGFLGANLGDGMDEGVISNTGTDSVTRLDLGPGADVATLNNSGTDSGLEILGREGMDEVVLSGAGAGGAVRLDTGDDQDEVTIQSTGTSSSTTVAAGPGVDFVHVSTTAEMSGLLLDGGSDADSIEVAMTGGNSVLEVRAGAGADGIRLHGTGVDSRSDLFGGTESDTFDLFDGDFGGVATLDQLFGTVCVFGEDHTSEMEGDNVSVTADVSGKDGSFSQSVTTTIARTGGDVLNILDRLATSASYVATANTVQRVAAEPRGLITHDGIEALNLESGSAPDTWSFDPTPDVNSTTLRTGAGGDQFTIESGSDDRLLEVDLGEGDDAAQIDTTGDRSVIVMMMGAGFDGVTVSSTGNASGLQIDTGADEDLVVIDDTGEDAAVRTMTGGASDHLQVTDTGTGTVVQADLEDGADSATVSTFGLNAGLGIDLGQGSDVAQVLATGVDGALSLVGQAGNDLMEVESTALGSLTDLLGGDGIDTFHLFAADSTLNGLLGGICVDGGAHTGAGTETRQQVVDVMVRDGEPDAFSLSQDVQVTVERGDRLFASDGGNVAGANYVLTAGGLARVGGAGEGVNIDFTQIEDLDFRTGAGADGVTLSGTPARTSILTRGGNDTIRLLASSNDTLLTIDTGADQDLINGTLSGQDALATLMTQDGNDTVSLSGFGVGSGARVETGAGLDTVLLASSPDQGNLVVSTGAGADSVEVADTGASSAVSLETGADGDIIGVNAVNALSGLTIDAGAGVDEVRVESINSDAGLKVLGGDDRDTVSTTLAVLNGSSELWGDTEEGDAPGNNQLDLFESLDSLDVANVPTLFVFQFDTLSLSAGTSTEVAIAPGSFDGFEQPFRIVGGDEDDLELSDAWVFDTTGFVDDTFFNQVAAENTILRISGFSPWQKPVDTLDINNNGAIDPLDALLLIGQLGVVGVLPTPTPGNAPDLVNIFHYDVNGDGALGPVDPLIVIGSLPDTAESGALRVVDAVFAELDADDDDEDGDSRRQRT